MIVIIAKILFSRTERDFWVQNCSGCPSISHFFFVDDDILFCKAAVSQGQAIKSILIDYEAASGQSVIFFEVFYRVQPLYLE